MNTIAIILGLSLISALTYVIYYDMLYPDNPDLAEALAQKEFNQIEELGT